MNFSSYPFFFVYIFRIGFTIGAVLGAYTYTHFDYLSVLFPGVFIGLCGLVYRIFKLKSVYFDFYRHIESNTKTETEQELKPLVTSV